jgi:hypothetical protein
MHAKLFTVLRTQSYCFIDMEYFPCDDDGAEKMGKKPTGVQVQEWRQDVIFNLLTRDNTNFQKRTFNWNFGCILIFYLPY